jgi:hypothetical protein
MPETEDEMLVQLKTMSVFATADVSEENRKTPLDDWPESVQ